VTGELEGFRKVERKPLRLLRPVPVYLLVSGSLADGDVNIMALSWLTPITRTPPRIGIVIDKSNYSHGLVLRYRWFSLSVVDIEKADLAKYVGTHSRREEDKIKKVGLKIVPWPKDPRVPVFIDSLGVLVCDVERTVDFGPSTLFVARIVDAYAKSGFFDELSGWKVGSAKILLHNAKHSFTAPCDERVVTKTKWGVAVKKPWRKMFENG
jgi:flavin reductase (DIM6/NTAB) family NADH-FMN oxidoreductase RutF